MRLVRFGGLTVLALLLAPVGVAGTGCSSSSPPIGSEQGVAVAPASPTKDEALDRAALSRVPELPYADVCSAAAPGFARCHAKVLVDKDGKVAASTTPQGYGPSQLASAYVLPSTGGSGKTVAIVDAYDDPKAESDLAAYRSQYGLPACTSANGCFKKVGQTGSTTSLPKASGSTGWAEEISLDVDIASAICPSCNILLVEANSASFSDLATAVNTAASLGASAISNSYGGSESSSDSNASQYNHPGVLVTAAAGDSGYGAEFPASSQYVVAVGGTTLTTSSSSRGWAESAWADSGSGCSAVVAKPSWQNDTICNNRVEADISADADPNTGVAVYDTYDLSGWAVFGGTSVATPLVASAFTLLGLSGQSPSFVWQNTGDFFDVTSGSNGSCSPSALCTAGPGYDGPTGWGTPNGAKLEGGTTCTPQCSGLACGPDGCGGSCGTCPSGESCNSSGQCVTSCTPNCAGKACGPDGCGGTCGTCPTGDSCNSSNQCVCTPSCSGKQCGSDGCGGTCGSCPSGETCGASGTCSSSGTCTHSECTTGAHLRRGCDACVSKVCNHDGYCCRISWDSICVGEVASYCGETCP